MKIKNISLSAISLAACLAGQTALGVTTNGVPTPSVVVNSIHNTHFDEFHFHPRFEAKGFTGDQTFSQAQLLLPLATDQNQAFYLFTEGNLAQYDSWMAGAGLGFRKIINDNIFGIYAVEDFTKTKSKNILRLINPGIEIFGKNWDVSMNGYFPIGTKTTAGIEARGANFGIYEYVEHHEHNEFDHRVKLFEETGHGGSLEISRIIPHFEKTKASLAGYYFHTPNFGSVRGLQARLSYDINKYVGVEIKDSFDNQYHNQTLVGIKFTFGGYNDQEKAAFGMSARLLDPIEHNVSIFSDHGLLLINKKYVLMNLPEGIERDNIWFFKPATSTTDSLTQTGDGTFENPFTFTPEHLEFVKNNYGTLRSVLDVYPLLYFVPGNYDLASFSSTRNYIYSDEIQTLPGRFNLPEGFGMYGRDGNAQDPYKMPANGDRRANFLGGIDLFYAAPIPVTDEISTTGPRTTLDSVMVYDGQPNHIGIENAAIVANDATDIFLQNVKIKHYVIGTTENQYNDAIGIILENACQLTLGNGNSIFAESIGASTTEYASAMATGISIQNSTIKITGDNNSIAGIATGGGGDGNNTASTSAYASGIFASKSTGSDVTTNAAIVISGNNNEIFGVAAGGKAKLSSGSNWANAEAYGIQTGNSSYSGADITISGNNNSFSATANNTNAQASSTYQADASATAAGLGAYASNNIKVSGNNNSFIGTASGGTANGGSSIAAANAAGLYLDSSTITFSGQENSFSATAQGGSTTDSGRAAGIDATGGTGSTIKFKDGSTQKIINAKGSSETYGIYIGYSSSLQDNGATVTDLSSFTTKYFKEGINRLPGGIGGSKIYWNGDTPKDLPW